ncbi:MAG: NAD(+) synthase [Selenomonadaceae bacterium]|nr:NAD(+) synthase [Selenomonadaceae bacterium]
MRIAYAQMKVAAGHPDINIKKILRLIDEARTQGADVVIFPELAVSGRMLGETLEQKAFEHDCWNYLMEIAKKSDEEFVIVLTGIEDFEHHVLIAQYGEFIDWEDYLGDLEIELKEDEFYSLGFLSDGAPCDNLDLCIRFNSAPFDFSKKFSSKKIAEGCPIIYIGCVGIQNTGKTIYTFDGASAVFNSRGELVQRAEPFKECLNFIELEKIDKMPAITLPEVSEAEKIYQAINFGVKEFLAQIGMKKVVIGVSGGIDSAVAAAIYVKVLGAENIYLVNMPSRFNSATTKNLSEKLANNLGCKYFVVPIQESVDWTVKQLEGVGLNVSSFVKENIQARDRSARILAAIAASVGGGFTCNANKAESTVGYATLYGDEAGFLSALADLWKFQVYELARYLNDKIYGREVIPQGIIDIVPSAELSTAQNVDEGKGDPIRYPYHDYLFRAFAERNLTPEDILNWYAAGNLEKNIGCASGLVKKYFPTPEDFILDLERWWRQFTGMGVAKRIQSPPILAVTDFPYGSRAESQNGVHFTKNFLELKDKLLNQ